MQNWFNYCAIDTFCSIRALAAIYLGLENVAKLTEARFLF